MVSILRGILLVACVAAGIGVAVFLGQSSVTFKGTPRSLAATIVAEANSPGVQAVDHGLQEEALGEPAPAPPTASTESPATARVSLEPRWSLDPAIIAPAVTQQVEVPENAAEITPEMVEKITEEMKQRGMMQQEQIEQLRQANPGLFSDSPPPSENGTRTQDGSPPSPTAAGGPAVGAGEPAPSGAGEPEHSESAHKDEPSAAPQFEIEPSGDGYYFNFPNMDIHEVLELLATQGNLNILPTKNVAGDVTIVLNGLSVEAALEAICRTNGLVIRRQDDLIYVGTPEDFATLNQSLDRVATRVFRPNYVSATDLQTLLTPLLSPVVGKISVTSAPQVGIASDGDDAGGNSLALGDAVVVQDYEAALVQMEQIVAEIDVRPMQVAIEAMILSVKLSDKNAFGINWNFLLNNQHVRMATGTTPDNISSTDSTTGSQGNFSGSGFNNGSGAGNIFLPNGGLAFAFLDQNLGSFVTALETIGDTDVIASPRLMCLNKQRAEILIGAKLGYVSTTVTETSTSQTVEFLEVGAQLRIRPFISTDGTIRMEVHPELSTGVVRIEEGFTLPDKEVTQVTTNIMVRDGCTVVIGGLMREDLTVNTTQVPLLGSLPGVGVLFRQRDEQIERREILVLVTPHIAYDPELAAEGEKGASEFHRRQRASLDSGNPLGRDYLGRKYLRMAQQALAEGKVDKASRLVDLAVRFDSNNRAAIDLQNDLATGKLDGEHHGAARMLYDPAMIPEGVVDPDARLPATEALGPEAIDGAQIDPRVLDQLQGIPAGPAHPRDPGEPGGVRDIVPGPREFE